jgi:iron complex transport system substrate-binding protein
MRVVSLLASATEIVCALGAGDSLVGRSHECDNPPWVRSLPPCSEPAFDISVSSRDIDTEVNRRIRSGEPLYRIDRDLIRALRPDLVIAQAHCSVCAVTPGDIERHGYDPLAARVIALTAGSLNGILESINQIAEAIGCESEGCSLVSREQQRLEAVRMRTEDLRRPSVVMLEWTDPLFAMGNWGPELVEIANGNLLLGSPGHHSRAIPPELLRDANPEYLIVAPCGFTLDRAVNELPVLETYPWWTSLFAVRSGRVAFADGNLFFNRSGMTISRTAEILAEILHGVTFGMPAESVHWCWMHQIGRHQPVVGAGQAL